MAFNEPGAARDSRTRRVELAASTRTDAAPAFGGVSAVPRHAITAGVATILEARRLRVLAFGREKAEIVRRALLEPVCPDVPASYLRGHPDLELWLDEAAASALERDGLSSSSR